MAGLDKVEYTFRGQLTNEDVLVVARQHWWLILWPVILSVIVLIIDGVIIARWGLSKVTAWPILATLAFLFLYLGTRWFLWANCLYILTTQRVIIVRQLAILKRVVNEAPLENVQSVKSEVSGFGGTIFGFGKVMVKTGAGENDLELVNVRAPYRLEQNILLAKKKY